MFCNVIVECASFDWETHETFGHIDLLSWLKGERDFSGSILLISNSGPSREPAPSWEILARRRRFPLSRPRRRRRQQRTKNQMRTRRERARRKRSERLWRVSCSEVELYARASNMGLVGPTNNLLSSSCLTSVTAWELAFSPSWHLNGDRQSVSTLPVNKFWWS